MTATVASEAEDRSKRHALLELQLGRVVFHKHHRDEVRKASVQRTAPPEHRPDRGPDAEPLARNQLAGRGCADPTRLSRKRHRVVRRRREAGR